jgi:hypothetical protein
MYKDYREKRKIEIEINVENYELSCSGCPTIFDFKDEEGTNYCFRLRHGGARIECEDSGEVLLSEEMRGFDGVCSWDDVIDWARKYGVLLNE